MGMITAALAATALVAAALVPATATTAVAPTSDPSIIPLPVAPTQSVAGESDLTIAVESTPEMTNGLGAAQVKARTDGARFILPASRPSRFHIIDVGALYLNDLESIRLPSSLTTINRSAFWGSGI